MIPTPILHRESTHSLADVYTVRDTTAVTTQQMVRGSLSGAFTLPGREGRKEGEEGERKWKRGGREEQVKKEPSMS